MLSLSARHMRREQKRQSPAREGWHDIPSTGTAYTPCCRVSEQTEMHLQVLRNSPTEEGKHLPWMGGRQTHTSQTGQADSMFSVDRAGPKPGGGPITMAGETESSHTSTAVAPDNQVWARGGASLIRSKMKGPSFRCNALLVAKIWNQLILKSAR